MALKNPKLFGLTVSNFFADVENKNQALTALNLPPLDLNVIRGSANAGTTRNDFMSLSRLTQPIYKTLDRYRTDSEIYPSIISTKAGTESILFGNLNINGGLNGNAIRYRYVDGTGPSAVVKIADISTSRVSAWSSVAEGPTVPISYGARVGIVPGGSLQFGTQSPSVSGPRLQTTITPQAKEFASEFPTHKINCTIGGQTVSLYAMKGIPLVFTGFFRNLDATITLTSPLFRATPASWKIVNTASSNDFTSYANQGDTTSSITYRSSISRERYIQFYYNPDNISSITINSANLFNLPITKLANATALNFSYNNLRNFPNLNTFSPILQSISFIQNPFFSSDTATERTLNLNIINKIPATVRTFNMGGTFYGSITQNIIADRFPDLTTLNLSRGGGAYFHPDASDNTCALPNVPNSCETYVVSDNDFRAIGIATAGDNALGRYNIKQLTKLQLLNLNSNYNLIYNEDDIISSNDIISVNLYNTAVRCPDLKGKQALATVYCQYNRNIGSIFNSNGTYKFDGCGSLRSLDFYASPLTGRMPRFTNPNLTSLELRYTSLEGGDPNGNNSFVIPERTFEQSPKLRFMLLQSGNLLTNAIGDPPIPIHPNAFTYTPNLYYLWYISYGRTGGTFPSITTCTKLEYLVLHYNNFSGSFPNLAANPLINYVDCSYNRFSGNIPGFKDLSRLNVLYLYNNQFTGINEFGNLPNLAYFYAQNNQMSGKIPNFGGCRNLYYLVLFNNKFTTYEVGSFTFLTRLNYLDLSNNLLSQQAINSIIFDLYTNYNSSKRGGVSINLRGNAAPNGVSLDYIDILKSKGWSIALD
jgi:Leucine-rich repeat (LRR) protein